MKITRIDLADPKHCAGLIQMLDHYAQTPEGGGHPLDPDRLRSLPGVLAQCPTWIGLLAQDGSQVVGLCDGFWSVSTFAARRLINIHDIAVHTDWRRRGIAHDLLESMTTIAFEMDCCKITLEVLEGNTGAMALYRRAGFEAYQLDPAMGRAGFMHKWLR